MATGMFSSFTTKSDSGIRIYKPSAVIDDADETDFEKRKMLILQAERDHNLILDKIATKMRSRNGSMALAIWVSPPSFLTSLLHVF